MTILSRNSSNSKISEDLMLKFRREFEAVGGKVYEAKNIEEVRDHILQALQDREAKIVARTRLNWESEMKLDESLAALGIKVVDSSKTEDLAEKLKKAEVGITDVDFAIAETGTIAIVTDREADRMVSALPLIHIALLNSRDIVLGFDDAVKLMHPKLAPPQIGRGRVISFITGPSRTSDIAKKLVLGIHGPNELRVIILR